MLPSDFLEKSKLISFEFFRGGREGVKRHNYSNFFSLYIIAFWVEFGLVSIVEVMTSQSLIKYLPHNLIRSRHS